MRYLVFLGTSLLAGLLWFPGPVQARLRSPEFFQEAQPVEPSMDAACGGERCDRRTATDTLGSSEAGALADSVDFPTDTSSGAEARRARPWVLLPHAFYSPETGFAGGAVLGHYAGGGLSARASSVLSSVTLTVHRQVIVEILPELYHGGGKLWLSGNARAMRYPDVFYGVGQATTPEMEESFTSRTLALDVQVQREVGGGNWLGLRAQLQSEDVLEMEEHGLLAGGVTGANGGTALGLGVVATRDTRDRTIFPARGLYVEAKWTGFTPSIGSDYRFGMIGLDARTFMPLGPGILAVRGRLDAATGDAPFTMLPKLGGSRMMRGYREGRFRDDLAGVLEGEYRFPIAWRLGGVLFGGVGDVASGPSDLSSLAELERAAGVGLRIRVNAAGVNVRLDWARGREAGGLYLGLGEAF